MPLRLPDRLPAIELLKQENIFVMDTSRASTQDIRPLRIAILNLMPIKITTETDLIRLLSNTPLQVEVDFMKIKSHTSKNTPIEHMQAFYRDFDEMKKLKYDGLIVTGAPLEQMEYNEVKYWDELTEVFNWAHRNVPQQCSSAGLLKPACTTSTVYRNMRQIKKCSACSSIMYLSRCFQYSADSTIHSTYRTAAIQK